MRSARQRGIALRLAVAGIGGIAAAGVGSLFIKKANDTANRALDVASQRADDLIRAIPGERYLRLIDALHGNDPKAREDAKAFLTSMAGVKPNASYSVSMAFGFDEAAPIRAQLLLGATSSRDEVVRAYRVGEVANLRRVGKAFGVPLTHEQRRDVVTSRINATIRKHIEFRRGDRGSEFNVYRPVWRSIGNVSGGFGRPAQEGFNKFTQAFSDEIAGAFLLLYDEGVSPAADGLISLPWDPIRPEHNYVFLVIPKSELAARTSDACLSDSPDGNRDKCIKVWVHEAGKSSTPLNGQPPFEFSIREFCREGVEYAPVPHPTPGEGEVCWAARRINHNQLFDRSTIESMDALGRLLDDAERRRRG